MTNSSSPWRVSSWYPVFRDYTFKTEILNPPHEFFQYLQENGVILGLGPVSQCPDWPSDVSSCDEDSTDLDVTLLPEQRFPSFHEKIEETMEQFHRQVFIKLGLNSPKVLLSLHIYLNLESRMLYGSLRNLL